MQEDRFDDKIRELLNQIQEDYDASSWQSLSDKLDQQELISDLEEHDIIPAIKEILDDQKIQVNENHWESMKSDLDYIQERRERLYVIKMLEAAVILLLIFTYFNFHWHNSDLQVDSEYFANLATEMNQPEAISAKVLTARTPALALIHSPSIETSAIVDIPSLPIGPLQVITSERSGLTSQFGSGGAPTEQETSKIIEIAPLANSTIDHLEINYKVPNTPETSFFAASEKKEKTYMKGWSFAVPMSYDVSFINSDINLGYLSNQIQSGLGGTSLGLSVSFRKNYFEVESGIKYSQKTFVPGLLTNYTKAGVNSFLESQLKDMNIHQIQIPVIAKFHAMPYKSSSFYGIVGVALNGITANTYNISRTVQSKAVLESSPLTHVIDLKKLPQGLAQGGPLAKNVYITSIIGFGVQSHISNGVSWYFQPQYQHSFTSKINPLISRINTLNVETGIRFAF